MDIVLILIGFLMLILGIIIYLLIRSSSDRSLLDTSGANIELYSVVFMLVLGGIYLIFNELIS